MEERVRGGRVTFKLLAESDMRKMEERKRKKKSRILKATKKHAANSADVFPQFFC